MKTLTERLTDILGEAFESCGYDRRLGRVSLSGRTDLCQFQCNGAFEGAKLYKKAPLAIAGEVAAVLDKNIFSLAEAAPPGFINLTLRDEYLLSAANAACVPDTLAGQTAVIDYGGPNIAKPLHIGHLRAAVIGESVKRILRAAGARVIGDIHLGDWGLQIGLVITELKARHPDLACFSADFDPEINAVPEITLDDLSEIYPFASKKSKEDEEYKAAALRATFELQNGHAGYTAVWRRIMDVSLPDLKKIYGRLGVSFDCWYGESDAAGYIPRLMNILEEKGLLRESDGALVADVAEEGDKVDIPPVIVKKSDGSSIYATTDLATIVQRRQDFAPDKILYVTDSRQSLHFTQVFRLSRKAGLVPETTGLEFLGFGTVNGPDGKPFKTRDGGTMKLEELLNAAAQAAYDKLESSAYLSTTDEGEKNVTAEKIGIAAVKFGDLINQRTKDYIFDMNKFLSFEGKTGPYVLYTVTRINSILRKLGVDYDDSRLPRAVHSAAERELYLLIAMSGEQVARAAADRAPNYVCESLYQLAAAFSRFYHDSRIIDEPDAAKKADWTALILAVRRTLMLYLDLLGIEPVESM